MTTSYDSFLDSSSPYYFWKERVGTIVKPSEKRKNNSALQTQTVSSTLLELCTSSLFGDGQWMHCTSGLDLLATNFVMVSVLSYRWEVRMAEPMVLSAGLNYFADHEPHAMIEYLSAKMFATPGSETMSDDVQRSRQMELIIAARFMQGWWLEPDMQKFLPDCAFSNIKMIIFFGSSVFLVVCLSATKGVPVL